MVRHIAMSDSSKTDNPPTKGELIAENERLRRLLKATMLDLQGLAEDSERILGMVTEALERIDDKDES
jgi:hypothetical protein